jgi:DNA polymerase (family 10)
VENRDAAKILRETAQLLEIEGAIIGGYCSYEKAAELLEGMHERIADIARGKSELSELPGVGDGIARYIPGILKTGDYGLRKRLRKKYPATILTLLELHSGPTRGDRRP